MCPRAIFKSLQGATTMRPRHQNGRLEVRGAGKRKYYSGRYNVYVKDETGKSVRKQLRVFIGYVSDINKSDAWEQLNQLIFQERPSEVKTSDKVSLEWFFTNRFLPLREPRWERVTAESIRGDWRNYLLPELGSRPLAELDKFILQTHFNQLAQRHLSKWTIKRVKAILSGVFIEAVDLGFMATNPLARVKLPKCKPAHKPVLEAADARRLENALGHLSERDRLIFRMAVNWGPRASEIFGLTVDAWRHDPANGDYLEIRATAYKGQLRPMKVKTENSYRHVPLPPGIRTALADWIDEQKLSGNDVLFPGRDGTNPLWPNTWLQKHVQPIAKQLGIAVPITFQVLRRSFSTRHRNQLKDAAAVCGHSEATASKLYAQSVSQAVRELVEEDERRIFGEPQPKTEKIQ